MIATDICRGCTGQLNKKSENTLYQPQSEKLVKHFVFSYEGSNTCRYFGRPLVEGLRRGRRNKRNYTVLGLLLRQHLGALHD